MVYAFTTKVCDLVNAGPEGTIIGKWDEEIQFDKQLGTCYYREDIQTGRSRYRTVSWRCIEDRSEHEFKAGI
ncbi:MAG: hypothetical protein UDG85_09465 [Anaerostipes hadrus]|nr:hypothetical protein [Anaerostipes hadrus]